MADLPGEGYVDRYSDALKVLLGARSGEPIHELAPELVPVIVLEESPAEFHAPLGRRDWSSGQFTQIGDATHFAQVEVLNPTGSNHLVVVTAIRVRPQNTTGFLVILDGTASGGSVSSPILLDTRLSGKSITVVSPGKPDLAIGAQQVIDFMQLGAGATMTPIDGVMNILPIVLFPGHRVKVEADTVNITISAGFFGYERPLVAGEDKTR